MTVVSGFRDDDEPRPYDPGGDAPGDGGDCPDADGGCDTDGGIACFTLAAPVLVGIGLLAWKAARR